MSEWEFVEPRPRWVSITLTGPTACKFTEGQTIHLPDFDGGTTLVIDDVQDDDEGLTTLMVHHVDTEKSSP